MHNFLQAIENFFSSAWKGLLTYLKAAIPEATAALLTDLCLAADPIVSDLENQSLTGQQKKDAAVAALSAVATKAAWDVGASLINTAIELAVQKLKNTPKGNAGVVTTGAGVTPAVA